MTLQEDYELRCKKPEQYADIWEHLPTLRAYAEKCTHITEFGVRTGNSTCALLHGLSTHGGTLHSYDTQDTPYKPTLPDNVSWHFTKQDTGFSSFSIAPTQLLFIDSLHEYPHIMRELKHHINVSRYIILHDTSIDWIQLGGRGPRDAVTAFLARHATHWAMLEEYENCNGLTVLQRLTQ